MSDNSAGLCKNCGAALEPDSKFCVSCGAPIPQEPDVTEEKEQEAAGGEETLAETAPEPQEQAPPEQPPTGYYAPPPPAYAPSDEMPFPDAQAPPQAEGYRQERRVKTTGVFAGGILGFVVMAALLAAVFIAGMFNENFFVLGNIHFNYNQFVIYGTIACCAVLTSRAKGPDLTVGAVMALTGVIIAAVSGSWIFGLIIAVSVCITVGAANGALIVYLRMPAILVTLLMSALIRGTAYLINGSMPMAIEFRLAGLLTLRIGMFALAPLIMLAIAFITVFLMILLSKLGKPLRKREASDQKSISYFLAYIVSALLAGMLGFYLVCMNLTVSAAIGTGYEIFVLFIFAAVTSSRFLDNRGVPALYVIPAALVFVLLMNLFNLYRFGNMYIYQMFTAVVTIGMAIVSYFARKDTFKGLVQRL